MYSLPRCMQQPYSQQPRNKMRLITGKPCFPLRGIDPLDSEICRKHIIKDSSFKYTFTKVWVNTSKVFFFGLLFTRIVFFIYFLLLTLYPLWPCHHFPAKMLMSKYPFPSLPSYLSLKAFFSWNFTMKEWFVTEIETVA